MPVKQKFSSGVEKTLKYGGCFGGKLGFREGLRHQSKPVLARGSVNRKRSVAHAQSRMAAVLNVSLGPAEAANEEVSKACFGRCKVPACVHGAKDGVGRNAAVESRNQSLETVITDSGVYLKFFHDREGSICFGAFAIS